MTTYETVHHDTVHRDTVHRDTGPAFAGLDILGFLAAVIMVLGPMVPMATIASYPGLG
ncbi:hypothetical protein [Zavarzinia sp. CC-PAN008]|uniref:hypothetical protein n=1 Tax=Zavarzinia sp. CC-PAN008 TaxID=3243332 RepID=UPI003F747F70